MAGSLVCKLVTLVLALSLVLAPAAEAVITCGTVAGALTGCIGYIRSPVTPAVVPGGCCSGVSKVNSLASTPADRKAACNCLKKFAGQLRGVNYKAAEGLPSKCKVNVPYKISPNTDCSRFV